MSNSNANLKHIIKSYKEDNSVQVNAAINKSGAATTQNNSVVG